MTPRRKKLLLLVALLPYLGAYVFAAAALGERLPERWWAQLPYFALAGVLWALPLKPAMDWANAGRARTEN